MTERRRPRRDGRLTRFAPALAVAVVFAGGSALVFADGGDPNQIHACVENTTTRANVIVVGPDQTCPGGTTPVHWLSAGATRDEYDASSAMPPTQVLESLPIGKKAEKKLYKPLGIKTGNTIQETDVYSDWTYDDGLIDLYGEIQGGAICPPSHPYRMSGGWTVENAFDGADVNVKSDGPVGLHAWHTYLSVYLAQDGVTALKVTVTCAKVSSPLLAQKK